MVQDSYPSRSLTFSPCCPGAALPDAQLPLAGHETVLDFTKLSSQGFMGLLESLKVEHKLVPAAVKLSF